jgi:hypothetical protein
LFGDAADFIQEGRSCTARFEGQPIRAAISSEVNLSAERLRIGLSIYGGLPARQPSFR